MNECVTVVLTGPGAAPWRSQALKDGWNFVHRLERSMAAQVEGPAEAQAGRQETPAACSGWRPAWGVGVRMMRACVTERDTEDRETVQETCSATHRRPRATAACLLQENRIFVSIPGTLAEVLAGGRSGAGGHTLPRLLDCCSEPAALHVSNPSRQPVRWECHQPHFPHQEND